MSEGGEAGSLDQVSAEPSASSSYTIPMAKESRKLPLQYTGFYPLPPLNTKYVSSTFIKTDAQTLAGRIAANTALRPQGVTGTRRKRKAEDEDDAASDDDEDEEEQQQPAFASAAKTIIIHPGSTHTRVGLATDVSPVTWPSVVARRNRLGASSLRSISARPPAAGAADGASVSIAQSETPNGKGSKVPEEEGAPGTQRDARINNLRTDLKQIMRHLKLRGVANGKGLAASYNASAKSESIPSHNDFGDEWTPEDPKQAKEIEMGDRALKLASLSPLPGSEERSRQQNTRPWELFRPFQAGKLNHAAYLEAFGSVGERVLSADIASLFRSIVSSPREDLKAPGKVVEGAGQTLYGLGISPREYDSHSVILIIPDLFPKEDIRLLTDIVMTEMGFAQIIVQQESTAATFGAGMSSAIVVHVGGERSSVSCVDEGLLLQETRMHLDYGGHDITLFLHDLLKRANFAYRECDPDQRVVDALILEDLKRQMITLDPHQIGLFIYNFFLRLPNTATKKYEVRVYDEAILAPMVMFGLGIRILDFAAKEKRNALESSFKVGKSVQLEEDADEDDDNDAPERARSADIFMPTTEAMVSSVKHLMPQATAEGTALPVAAGESVAPESKLAVNGTPAPGESSAPSRDNSVAPSMAHNPSDQGKATPVRRPTDGARVQGFDVLTAASQVSLDAAIFHSLLLSSSPTAQGPFPQAPTAGQMASSIAAGEERMRRLAGNILVIGGTARVPGMGAAIEGRLTPHLEAHYANKAQEKAIAAQAAQAEAAKAKADAEEATAAAAAAAAASSSSSSAAPSTSEEAAKVSAAASPAPIVLASITPASANAAANTASKAAAAATAAANSAASASAPTVSVIPPPRDLDPTLLAWKGMAVLPRLDSAADMWTGREEWNLLGWKAIRDKSAFL